jgi:hypothetical protein
MDVLTGCAGDVPALPPTEELFASLKAYRPFSNNPDHGS